MDIKHLVRDLDRVINLYPVVNPTEYISPQSSFARHEGISDVLRYYHPRINWKTVVSQCWDYNASIHKTGMIRVRLTESGHVDQKYTLKVNIFDPDIMVQFSDKGYHNHKYPFISTLLEGEYEHYFFCETDCYDCPEFYKFQGNRSIRQMELIGKARLDNLSDPLPFTKGEIVRIDPKLIHEVAPRELTVTLSVADHGFDLVNSVYTPTKNRRINIPVDNDLLRVITS